MRPDNSNGTRHRSRAIGHSNNRRREDIIREHMVQYQEDMARRRRTNHLHHPLNLMGLELRRNNRRSKTGDSILHSPTLVTHPKDRREVMVSRVNISNMADTHLRVLSNSSTTKLHHLHLLRRPVVRTFLLVMDGQVPYMERIRWRLRRRRPDNLHKGQS